MILEEYHLTTAEGCINHIIDEEGNHYHIPNYCINDPYFEKEAMETFKLSFGLNTNLATDVLNARLMKIDNQDFNIYYSPECPYVGYQVNELTEYVSDMQVLLSYFLVLLSLLGGHLVL